MRLRAREDQKIPDSDATITSASSLLSLSLLQALRLWGQSSTAASLSSLQSIAQAAAAALQRECCPLDHPAGGKS